MLVDLLYLQPMFANEVMKQPLPVLLLIPGAERGRKTEGVGGAEGGWAPRWTLARHFLFHGSGTFSAPFSKNCFSFASLTCSLLCIVCMQAEPLSA